MKKIKILLACCAGASTSILVRKLIEAGVKRDLEVKCIAYAVDTIGKNKLEADVILIGPQAGYMLGKIREFQPDIPSEVIGFQDYGMMNGDSVLDLAIKAVEERGGNK